MSTKITKIGFSGSEIGHEALNDVSNVDRANLLGDVTNEAVGVGEQKVEKEQLSEALSVNPLKPEQAIMSLVETVFVHNGLKFGNDVKEKVKNDAELTRIFNDLLGLKKGSQAYYEASENLRTYLFQNYLVEDADVGVAFTVNKTAHVDKEFQYFIEVSTGLISILGQIEVFASKDDVDALKQTLYRIESNQALSSDEVIDLQVEAYRKAINSITDLKLRNDLLEQLNSYENSVKNVFELIYGDAFFKDFGDKQSIAEDEMAKELLKEDASEAEVIDFLSKGLNKLGVNLEYSNEKKETRVEIFGVTFLLSNDEEGGFKMKREDLYGVEVPVKAPSELSRAMGCLTECGFLVGEMKQLLTNDDEDPSDYGPMLIDIVQSLDIPLESKHVRLIFKKIAEILTGRNEKYPRISNLIVRLHEYIEEDSNNAEEIKRMIIANPNDEISILSLA